MTDQEKLQAIEASEIINAISETLLRASGETIAEVAKAAGLNVTYVGDSLFHVRE